MSDINIECHICGELLNGLVYRCGYIYIGYSCCYRTGRVSYKEAYSARRLDRLNGTDVELNPLEELSAIQSSVADLPLFQEATRRNRYRRYAIIDIHKYKIL